jgi:hypothetical protein
VVDFLPPEIAMPPASRPSSKLEIVIGRSLAACAHPLAAWRIGRQGRILILVGYFLAGYLLSFVTLVSF